MHKGRLYPYHTFQYATEGWFWPGLCPWKVKVTRVGSMAPPWDVVDPGYNQISQAGVEVGAKTLSWFVPGVPSSGGYDFLIRAYRSIDGPDYEPTISIEMQASGTPVAMARARRPYPQRSFGVSGMDEWAYLPFPIWFTPGPPIMVQPATYAEGGSPWVGPG